MKATKKQVEQANKIQHHSFSLKSVHETLHYIHCLLSNDPIGYEITRGRYGGRGLVESVV